MIIIYFRGLEETVASGISSFEKRSRMKVR